jgi:ribonuclease BN (tRNA processing enzyme)
VLAYSADTGPTPALVELARDADLLVCEAAFVDDAAPNPPDLHLTGSQAARHAAAAGAAALMITHIPPWHDRGRVLAQARPHFDGPIELAVTHQRSSVSGRALSLSRSAPDAAP